MEVTTVITPLGEFIQQHLVWETVSWWLLSRLMVRDPGGAPEAQGQCVGGEAPALRALSGSAQVTELRGTCQVGLGLFQLRRWGQRPGPQDWGCSWVWACPQALGWGKAAFSMRAGQPSGRVKAAVTVAGPLWLVRAHCNERDLAPGSQ